MQNVMTSERERERERKKERKRKIGKRTDSSAATNACNATCYRASLPPDKVDVNYIVRSTFLRVHINIRPLFKAANDKSIFGSYIMQYTDIICTIYVI